MHRIGVVSYLNARPLVDGLDEAAGVRCVFNVPAALPRLLDRGEVDAALMPVIDLLRQPGRYEICADAGIASDGETMTVRVFAQVPPDRIRELWVDSDSHTSIALARVLWREMYARDLVLHPLDRHSRDASAAPAPPAVLLIGDKVVDPGRGSFAYEIDLGGAWREHTGLPFVFAAWARRAGSDDPSVAASGGELRRALSEARDRGVARAAQIAAEFGPRHGWPVALAERYLTRCMRYRLDERAMRGIERFAQLAAAAGLVPPNVGLHWSKDVGWLQSGLCPTSA